MTATTKTALITGATSGIGLATAKALLAKNYLLILPVRNMIKGQRIKDELIAQYPQAQIDLVECDLALMCSTQRAARQIIAQYKSIELLLNNAGTAEMQRSLSAEGIEQTFASNYLGHFVLTYHLLPLLKANNNARIVNTSSVIHYRGSKHFLEDINFERRRYFVLQAYADSKLANVLFSGKLARLLQGSNITVNSFHPGHVATAIWPSRPWFFKLFFSLAKKFFYISPEQGAQPLIFLATATEAQAINNTFYLKMTPRPPAKLAQDCALQDALWDTSLQLSAAYLD